MAPQSRVSRAVGSVRVSVQLDGVRNFRDLGGYPTADGRRVKPGTLFRSGHLANATDMDLARLARLPLRTVIDLRNEFDYGMDGSDVWIPGSTVLRMPLSDPVRTVSLGEILAGADDAALERMFGGGRIAESLKGVYRGDLVRRTEVHRRVFDVLLEDSTTPLVVHCSAGKDRTGWVSALILSALGVENDVVLADYLLSNDPARMYLIRMPDGSRLQPDQLHPLIRPLFEARPEYLGAALDAVTTEWGGLAGYLRDAVGLTTAEQARLRERYLVEAPAPDPLEPLEPLEPGPLG